MLGSLGYGLFLAWQSLIVFCENAIDMFEFELPTADQLLFAPANVLLLLAVAIYVNRTGRDLWTRAVVVLTFGVMALIPCVGLAMAQLPAAATVVVKVLRGITEGAAFLIWNAQLVRYRASTAWRMYAWAVVASSSLSMLGGLCPAPVIVGACALLPIASGWALLTVRTLYTDEHDYDLAEKTGWVLPWRPVFLTALYTFALSVFVHLQDAVCAERLDMMFLAHSEDCWWVRLCSQPWVHNVPALKRGRSLSWAPCSLWPDSGCLGSAATGHRESRARSQAQEITA